jgi:hypothetical protein
LLTHTGGKKKNVNAEILLSIYLSFKNVDL